jgi:hypothetical protein
MHGAIIDGVIIFISVVNKITILSLASFISNNASAFARKPSVVVWLFALSYEMSRGGSNHRIRGLFERAVSNDILCSSVVLWRCYIGYELNIAHNPSAARRIFFRAIHACPW